MSPPEYRIALEDHWRKKLDAASASYRSAYAHSRRVWDEHFDVHGINADGALAVQQARQAECVGAPRVRQNPSNFLRSGNRRENSRRVVGFCSTDRARVTSSGCSRTIGFGSQKHGLCSPVTTTLQSSSTSLKQSSYVFDAFRRYAVLSGARLETSCFDERYITGLRDRDPEAEAHFVAHFRKPIRLKAMRQLRAPDLVEDACQETILRVFHYFRSGKRLENPERLPAFVHTVCHNVTLEMIRSKTRYNQMPESGYDLPDSGSGPHGQLVTRERQELVREILSQLPEKDRELLRLAMLEEVDRAELCKRFGASEEYLRVLLCRARMRFRDELLKRQDQK